MISLEPGELLLHKTNMQHLNDDSSSMLLITGNVGSLFEDPDRLLNVWIKEFFEKVNESQPQFLALHLQEVGGKTYEKSTEHVQDFIRYLCEASEMQDYEVIHIYLDEAYNSPEYFTALGSLYFIHKSLKNVKIWNFLSHNWEPAVNTNIFRGNIETIPTKEKAKFPQHFFPECKWSRKGFMRTRWEINGTVIDLVNIHLFHDASNLIACEDFPSIYCKTRRRALVHTLERFHLDEKNGYAPYFVFGDFNFRCDTRGVIKELTQNLTTHRIQNIKADNSIVHYRNTTGDNVLVVGKKEFKHTDHQVKFKQDWLKAFDTELEALKEILVECSVQFSPSYPYEEDPNMPTSYMSTRCPAWCDRILMSPQAMELISIENIQNPYYVIGENVCMGDHKPIYLNIRLKSNQGTYRCCKCYDTNVYNNKSTSMHSPAVSINENVDTYCPYNNKAYHHIILEYKNYNKLLTPLNARGADIENIAQNDSDFSNKKKSDFSEIPIFCRSSQKDDNEIPKMPPVSINVIDSDNINVCMCSLISSSDQKDIEELSICPECRNRINKQPIEHRYRLVSKRLMLSNNIIINHIDTQYLNAHLDNNSRRQDTYTPESAESHSPCPEMVSNSTSSSNSRNVLVNNSNADNEIIGTTETVVEMSKPNKVNTSELSQRGVVSPRQLKSRLEDLQRSSLSALNCKSCNTAGKYDDVDDVDDDNCQSAIYKRQRSNCCSQCCNIH